MDYEGSKRCIILGGGGHARVLIDALSFREDVSIVGILDVSPDRWGTDIMGVLVLGADDKLEALSGTLDCFVVGLGTVGNTHPRRRL